jgi:predicted acetyltransferase
MSYEIRPITSDEFPEFTRTDEAAFGQQPSDQEIESFRPICELDRTLAAFDAGRIVATAGAISLELTLPGQTLLPVAGVTYVGVLPTHRRHGLLRALMRRQLDDLRHRGETLAILTASESAIYERFGYGLASSVVHVEIERQYASFSRPIEPAGRVSLVEHEAAMDVLPALYDRARQHRPGAVSRSIEHWRMILSFPAQDGFGPRFYAIYRSSSGEVEGAALYRIKQQREDGLSTSTLLLNPLIAVTPEANAALWRFCLDIDLVRTIRATNRPVDEPLRWMLADPRRLRTTALVDDLWLRLIDIPAALAARRYACSDRLVLEVSDSFCPENSGRYALDAGPDGAECRATTLEPDLALDVADLGAAYLGGVRLSMLARVGRVVERTPGAVERASALFASDPAPWCATPF